MQEHLRHLSRQLLRAQEDERKRISRELHDVIAQILTGINVRLAALKNSAASDTKNLERTSPARRSWWTTPSRSSIGLRANCAQRCWTTWG